MKDNLTNKLKKNIKKLIENGNLDEAKKLLNEYRKVGKEDVEIYSIIGTIYMIEGDVKEAEQLFLDGLKKDNNNFDLLYNLGYLYESTEAFSNSVYYYKLAKEKATTKQEKDEISSKLEADKFSNKFLDEEILNQFKNKDFNKIIKSIQVKINDEEYEKVIYICNYWINNVNKRTGIIYYFMGVATNAMKDFDNALKYHTKALELDNSLADLRHRKSKYKYNYKEEIVDCIGCGNENYELVNICNQSISEDNKELINPIRRWVKCKNCGLIYTNPIPGEKELNLYYSMIAKEKFGGIYGDIDNSFEFLVNMANKRLEKIERYSDGVKTILDIGTGIGIFTGVALDRGWQAEGLEFTTEDCEYAKEKFNLELKQENFYDYKGGKKYDVITLFEVIEHLQHPLKDLKQINRLIKDNGILVVATPIQDTLYGNKKKQKNVFWNVVTHLSYFTKDVMVNYLNKSGFRILEINGSNEGMGRMEFYCEKINDLK